ncbi:hypothetical protein GE061_013930 [Apolygus lucorum]|uniref:Uncharacterized protein n=1 Tax=Apolygus lucorum TaxID=248454 RepID=A0A6A4K9Z3_APOLU|nr:hypothetical protein GE061_013930 [Apolygus lucorum]
MRIPLPGGIGFYFLLCAIFQGAICLINTLDVRYWNCVMKKNFHCPDKDIRFYMYSHQTRTRKRVDIRSRVPLRYAGWDPELKNVIIIHGFNGTESKVPMTYLRDAYLRRGDYNVFTVDWEDIAHFPCYLSAISNTRLVAQCTAQFYSYLTAHGATAEKTVCVGHSLGAHICGMISNHLTEKVHKIVGLDPARPLVDRYGGKAFRLTRDDAHVVQVVHTNAGLLGENPQVGHVDFCMNGGTLQPSCLREGRRIRQARCSHFMSACYFAAAVLRGEDATFKGVPCTSSCRRIRGLEEFAVTMGEKTPDKARGTYCVTMTQITTCPFD